MASVSNDGGAPRLFSPAGLFLVGAGGERQIRFLGGQKRFEPVLIDGLHVSFERQDGSRDQLFPNRIIHELHSLALASNNNILKLLGRALADDRGDRTV